MSTEVVQHTPQESAFALAQRQAIALSKSELVPKIYQGDKGIPNCLIAFNMAQRIGTDPMLIMQNLNVIQGRPSFGSSFLIASVNSCGKFSPLRFEFDGAQGTPEWRCRAWAIEVATQERLNGAWISLAMAKSEGWLEKSGSKWKTMPEQMMMYRAGSFWTRIYAPEISMGMLSTEELADITPTRATATQADAEAVEAAILQDIPALVEAAETTDPI